MITKLGIINILLTLVITAVVISADSVAYTKISRTVQNLPCLSDCINGRCKVDYHLNEQRCTTDGLPAPRYRTSTYEGNNQYCLSNCNSFEYDYLWCFTSENYDWDYCSWSSSPNHSYDYKGNKCTTPCTTKFGFYTCNSKTGSNTKCAPSAIVRTANCDQLLFSKNGTRTKRGLDNIYDINAHPLVVPTFDDFVANQAELLEQQYGINHVNIRNNPISQYTARDVVNQNGITITLPLVVRATITRSTLSQSDRNSSAISPAAYRNVRLMMSSDASTAGLRYDTGHLIAFVNGGPSDVMNFVPQTLAVNRGPWRNTERFINEWCMFSGSVDMTVVAFYTGASLVPESFGVKLVFYEPGSDNIHADCVDTIYLNHFH